jgi:ketosteroid isomerase-like protein
MVGQNETERARALVKSFYDGAARGAITDFRDSLAEDFELLVPAIFPGAAGSARSSMSSCFLGSPPPSIFGA